MTRVGSLLLCAVVYFGCGMDPSEPGDSPARRMVEPVPPQPTWNASCVVPKLPATGRPVDIVAAGTFDKVASLMPCIADPELVQLFESTDTMWYDKFSIVPAYQDSAGDNVTFPVGLRPNTIAPNLIVTGGHAAFFSELGTFHFPFGRPIGSKSDSAAVVDFWHVPRKNGAILPVVWWQYKPNSFTWRYEWMFPVGTVFGEMIYSIDGDGQWWPFEIRTRTRGLNGWTADAFRPFPTAQSFASALEEKRVADPVWAKSEEISALIAHALDDTKMVPGKLAAPKLPDAFATQEGAEDPLPDLEDDSILKALLMEVGFQSAKGARWKGETLAAYAPTSTGDFHIVPKGYNGGFVAVDDASCERCHVDAGHPFKDYHDFVYLYGEVWGADEVFSWHPFAHGEFVNADGTVKNFNHNNRKIRTDFASAGVVAPYDKALHTESDYQRLKQPWSDFSY